MMTDCQKQQTAVLTMYANHIKLARLNFPAKTQDFCILDMFEFLRKNKQNCRCSNHKCNLNFLAQNGPNRLYCGILIFGAKVQIFDVDFLR